MLKVKSILKNSTFTGTSYDGKSPAVIKAMKKREKELKKKQEEARIEMERQKKLAKDAAEDKDKAIEVYGNKIKAWAEENGVKRDIRGLLSSMQNVLWEGIEWKPINMGDLLADGKVKLGYYKASRVMSYFYCRLFIQIKQWTVLQNRN